MKITKILPILVQTATAILLGITSFQNSASANVNSPISGDESNSSRPQLLVRDAQQVAILTKDNTQNSVTTSSNNGESLKKYTFSGNQKLNQLTNLAHQSIASLVALESSDESQPVVINVSSSSNADNAIYIPIETTEVDNSESLPIPLEVQEEYNEAQEVIKSNETETTEVSHSIPLNVISPTDENIEDFSDYDPNNNSSEPNKPVLIAPVAVETPDRNNTALANTSTDSSVIEIEIDNHSQPLEAQDYQDHNQEVASRIPIQVEYYNPGILPSDGEMVSPDLPYLYPPDQYLPDGSRPFNGYIWPAKGVLTSGYGWRWGRMHKGIDIAAPIGTPVVAVADGKVISAGWNSGGYGNLIKVKHDDGSITLYAHNSKIFVRGGQEIKQGQHIANMGSTGFSTGPHLHFEVHPIGQSAVNPIAFLPKK
jgi:murein DD-endopeptidase MepM/ murein hydrolase activator NlpD